MSDLVELSFRGVPRGCGGPTRSGPGLMARETAERTIARKLRRVAGLYRETPELARAHGASTPEDWTIAELRPWRLFRSEPEQDSPPGHSFKPPPAGPPVLLATYDTEDEADEARRELVAAFTEKHTPPPFDVAAWRKAVRASIDPADLSDAELDKHAAALAAKKAATAARVAPWAERIWSVVYSAPDATTPTDDEGERDHAPER